MDDRLRQGARLRLGIDGCCFSSPKAGIGRYVYELCKELDHLLPQAEFFLYARVPPSGVELFPERWTWRLEPTSTWKRLRNTLWLKLRAGSLIRHDNLDVFWCCEVVRPRLPSHTKAVVTVYDLIHELFPQFLRLPTRLRHRLFYRRDIRRADAIVAISQGTADRLRLLYNCHTTAIVRCAVSKEFRRADDATLRNTLRKYRLASPYILSVATWQPNKNLELLIETFLSMRSEGLLPQHSLALVGPRGWKDARLAALVSESSTAGILPLGYVADEDLPALYSGADVLVFPSLYEGFGLPVLEARACGTPVVATDVPEIREAGGGKAIYITPDAEGIRSGILQALNATPPSLNGHGQAGLWTWRESARLLAEVILAAHSKDAAVGFRKLWKDASRKTAERRQRDQETPPTRVPPKFTI